MDRLIRAISEDGLVKMSAISSRHLVERARNIHKCLPVATAALGRLLSATSMMGAMLKEEKGSVTIRVDGRGPLGSLVTVSDSSGNVRGYVQNPDVHLPPMRTGKLNVGRAVGRNGSITVSKDLGLKEPYVGSARLISGEIAEDIAGYYVESEQIGAACGLGVLVDTDQSVMSAGGYIVELMPGAAEEQLRALETNLASLGSVSDLLGDEQPQKLIDAVLEGFSPKILQDSEVEYRCYCTRERIAQALRGAGLEALEEMAGSEDNTEVSCQFCDKKESFTPAEIQEILDLTTKEKS